MSCKLRIICVLTILQLVASRRPFNLIFDELKCTRTHDGPPIEEFFCNKYEKGNKAYIDARMILSQQLNSVDVRVVTELPRSGGEETVKFLDLTVNGCKLLEDAADGNNIVKACLDFMRKSGNMPDKCPIAANVNYTLDGLLIDAELLPPYTPELNFLAKADLIFDHKVAFNVFIKGRVERKRKGVF